jgi:hypothetical protein
MNPPRTKRCKNNRDQKVLCGRSLDKCPPILRLPPELLLSIARHVLETRTEYWTTILTKPNISSLLALSQTHSALRAACIAGGMFSRVRPVLHFGPQHFIQDYKQLERLFQQAYSRPHISSLSIDLSNWRSWNLCAHIMEKFPDLEELVFTGQANRTTEKFVDGELGQRCALFKGKSLILRHAHFTELSFPVLRKLERDSIVSLQVEESVLHINRMKWILSTFSRNLQNVKLIGLMDYWTAEILASSFIPGSCITHFEMGYRVKPCLLSERNSKQNLEKEQRLPPNRIYTTMRRVILRSLRRHSATTLKTFVDQHELKGPFVGDSHDVLFPWQWHNGIRSHASPFKNMKLLAFRCEKLESLIKFDGIDDCTVGCLWREIQRPDGVQDHSVWMYLSTLYAFFSTCDCILIETKLGGACISDSWWQFPSQRLMSTTIKVEGNPGSLRFFIVGNRQDGYSGVERNVDVPSVWNKHGQIWTYRKMDAAECKQTLFELGFYGAL